MEYQIMSERNSEMIREFLINSINNDVTFIDKEFIQNLNTFDPSFFRALLFTQHYFCTASIINHEIQGLILFSVPEASSLRSGLQVLAIINVNSELWEYTITEVKALYSEEGIIKLYALIPEQYLSFFCSWNFEEDFRLPLNDKRIISHVSFYL